MPFNSFNFWLIFPNIFGLYWLIPSRFNRIRNCFLVLVSYLLYLNWKPSFAILLAGITIVTYLGGLILEKPNIRNRKSVCSICVVLALLPLIIFKYYNFLNEVITGWLEAGGIHFSLPGLNWAIPIGISFYTFQAVGYLFDVYHRRIQAESDFIDYSLFVCFFPQVTSGPISTAKELIPQFKAPHSFSYELGRDGAKMLIWGMFLKIVIADRIGIYVDSVCANFNHFDGSTCLLASVLYAIQIYCDFSGYSLMAIGIAKFLGFDLINNFNRPYLAASITEFWRRWHISLTRWLTTHVYINMGGNKCSKPCQYLNIMVTFVVSGLWHGANWTFLVWGILHGFFQIVEKAFWGSKIKAEIKSPEHRLSVGRSFRIILTFCLVCFAWIFFRMPSVSDAFDYIGQIFFHFRSIDIGPLDAVTIVCLGLSIPLLLIKEIVGEYGQRFVIRSYQRWIFYIYAAICVVGIGVLDSGQFIYVNF